ncbi:Multiple epidermal growth factor-like domains protein 6 [Bagarius yarrelli]|uniref:Multiple epidermal growth factor-like domains protein 6 n=1 Tax=Bagarius yarrelli TaxID=175774 RepID=A0A556V4J3_BAGYA|nr:Multiple epidermal growth factor-like domains protein 6 [Bagarius yarrelli]
MNFMWTLCGLYFRPQGMMDFTMTSFLMLLMSGIYGASRGADLMSHMPNVCTEQQVKLVAHMQPCVQAFTRMVKVWKQGCEGQSWCVGYERRTAYYTAYRQVYRQDYQTVHKCCPGWSQLNGEAGCLYLMASALTEAGAEKDPRSSAIARLASMARAVSMRDERSRRVRLYFSRCFGVWESRPLMAVSYLASDGGYLSAVSCQHMP